MVQVTCVDAGRKPSDHALAYGPLSTILAHIPGSQSRADAEAILDAARQVIEDE
jgi:hypothetical protein